LNFVHYLALQIIYSVLEIGFIGFLELVSEMLCCAWNSRQWKKFRSPVILSYITFPFKDLVLSSYMICLFVVQLIMEPGTLNASEYVHMTVLL
jgi:hypothetical protein